MNRRKRERRKIVYDFFFVSLPFNFFNIYTGAICYLCVYVYEAERERKRERDI